MTSRCQLNKYKKELLPFDIFIDPKDVNQSRLYMTDPGIRLDQLDGLQDDIKDAEELIRAVKIEIDKEFY